MSLIESERAGEIYRRIGQAVVDLLPGDFEMAWARAGIHDDFCSFELFFRKPGGRIGYLDEGLAEVERGFRELLREFPAGEKWTNATFRLRNDGNMSIDFGHEDIADFEQAPARRRAWISRYLGDPSAIDW